MKHLFYLLFCLILVISKISGFCLGLFCSYMPIMAKSCCSVTRKCCGHYQAWLSPLIVDESSDDYLQAITHEFLHENIGPNSFFDMDVHRYPGVFTNINKAYKRHNKRADNDILETSKNEVITNLDKNTILDTQSSQNNFVSISPNIQ